MDIQKIKELALANGFKLKEQASGNMDLNAYVYDFANAIEQATKAQAVPEHTNQTFEEWLDDPENTKVYLGGYRERANQFAHQAWRASLKAKLPKDKILMPRSLDQKSIDYAVHQLAISSGISLIAEVYECLIEAQEQKG